MDTEQLEAIIYGIPNFAGFTIGLTLLYRRLRAQDERIKVLIEKWSDCEDDKERSKIAESLQNKSE